ncbi:hypothetical protein Rumeso_03424 [Rubellimicrobium mesophilum DSM 19309]|uniref:Uncharacterized protein n=1 Tax=Rubellimicrobium mesophilum DSM 19309 TaxID=442562 RepID=A0A017HL09_9RHOB|nr:hypothetical protein [Rubellimicrobium mesophilum]EYD75000.1 hypothetical protein Rumeso_03424 [Rubellimicrobium mesophilum DSM 19309]
MGEPRQLTADEQKMVHDAVLAKAQAQNPQDEIRIVVGEQAKGGVVEVQIIRVTEETVPNMQGA